MADEATPVVETKPAENKAEKPTTHPNTSRKTSNEIQMDFVPGSMLEARDFADNWFLSKVVEVDNDGREVLVHFQNWSSRYDEWISMDSARLRPVTNQSEYIFSLNNFFHFIKPLFCILVVS